MKSLLAFAFISCCALSCEKKVVEQSETIADPPSRIISGQFLPGRLRTKLQWELQDKEKPSKCRIYWKDKGDSLDVDIPIDKDTISIVIDNLEEGDHSFSIIALDAAGLASVPVTLSGNVYGTSYEKGLENRHIKSVEFTNERAEVTINWGSAQQGTVRTEVNYTDAEGNHRELQASLFELNTTLPNCTEESAFEYRTIYLPHINAIDTFYTDYDQRDVSPPPVSETERLTQGWTLNDYSYSIQTAHDIPESERYSFNNGEHRFWIYPGDSPHTPTSNTGPRSELRMKNNYTTGRHQFEGDVYVVSGSAGTDIMQVFGGQIHATAVMLKIHAANGGTIRRYDNEVLMNNVYNRWIHVNVQHDADAGQIYVYLDGQHVGTFEDRGDATHYFKCGAYNITGARSETRWKNIKYWTGGPVGI